MASLIEVVRQGKGTAGAWQVTRATDATGTKCYLYHYSTCMLVWDFYDPANEATLDYSLGWGSVSDQGGMNKVFRELCIPLYYSRKGGAEIVSTRG